MFLSQIHVAASVSHFNPSIYINILQFEVIYLLCIRFEEAFPVMR